MLLPAKIKFGSEKLNKYFLDLKNGDSNDKKLFQGINKAIEKIEANSFSGIQIQKNLIPDIYIKSYNLTNLWKYNLPGGWRLLYSIKKDNIIILAIIVDWLNHKDYEKKFKY